MASGLADLAGFLAHAKTGRFEPKPYYEPKTDSLLFYARNEKSYGQRINRFLTLFLATNDHSLIGCELKEVSRILKAAEELNVLMADRKIRLLILIRIALIPELEQPPLIHDLYDELEEVVKDIEVDSSELCPM